MTISITAFINRVFGRSNAYTVNAAKSFSSQGKLLRGLEKRFIRFANKAEARFSNPMTRYIKRGVQSLERRNLTLNTNIIHARYGEGAFAYLQGLHVTDFKRLDQLESKLQATQDLKQSLIRDQEKIIANAKAQQADPGVNIDHLSAKGLKGINEQIQQKQNEEEKLIQQIKDERLTLQNFGRSRLKYRLHGPLSNRKWAQMDRDLLILKTRINQQEIEQLKQKVLELSQKLSEVEDLGPEVAALERLSILIAQNTPLTYTSTPDEDNYEVLIGFDEEWTESEFAPVPERAADEDEGFYSASASLLSSTESLNIKDGPNPDLYKNTWVTDDYED